jgi:hypothetical protein
MSVTTELVISATSNEVDELENVAIGERDTIVARAVAEDDAIVLDDDELWIERERLQQCGERAARAYGAAIAVHDERRAQRAIGLVGWNGVL